MYRDETGRSNTWRDCGVRFAAKPWHRVRTVGHNVPLSRVRPNETREFVKYDQCAACNADQGTRTPEEWRADQAAGDVEPVRALTDEQKRIRARVTWDKAYRRKHPSGKPKFYEIPDHLRSHDEILREERSSAKHMIERSKREIGQRERELADAEIWLNVYRDWPTDRSRLFGLVKVRDAKRDSHIKSGEERSYRARSLLKMTRAVVAEAHATLQQLDAVGEVADCPCVDCSHDFDVRAEDYRAEKEEERRERWRPAWSSVVHTPPLPRPSLVAGLALITELPDAAAREPLGHRAPPRFVRVTPFWRRP